jgi:hypothetical protein
VSFNPLTGLGCRNDDDCQAGYRLVGPGYVDALAPVTAPPYPELGPRPPADAADVLLLEWDRRAGVNEAHRALLSSKRASAANSVYPCPNCNPDQFIRWQAGAWPYPRRGGDTPVANEAPDPPTDDELGLFADLAVPYSRGIPDEDF